VLFAFVAVNSDVSNAINLFLPIHFQVTSSDKAKRRSDSSKTTKESCLSCITKIVADNYEK
jgi:hypothetical protein